jgi:hypothetical protein
MKIQYNAYTDMFFSYIPRDISRILKLKKGDEIEYTPIENGVKIEIWSSNE